MKSLDNREEVLTAAAFHLAAMGRIGLAQRVLDEVNAPPLRILISSAVKASRKRLGLTQKCAAQLCKLPLATYLTAEYGQHTPTQSTIDKLGGLINVRELLRPALSPVNLKVA